MKWVKRISVVLGTAILCGGIAGFCYMFSSINAAEPLVEKMGDKIKEYNSKPSRIFSKDGKLLYEVWPIYQEPVVLSELPDHVKKAILAAEDKRFYEHSGVDYWGLGRAVRNVVARGKPDGGGSTITMQLAKKLFSASEFSMKRKVQDIAIATQIEKHYTKDQILELYLNQIYYGEQAYGLNAAAEIYFNKKADELDLAEAAMIARCIRLPSTQNPVRNYQLADQNKIVVLGLMKEEGWITQDEYDKAKAEKPKVKGLSKQKFSRTHMAPYFVAAVKRDLEKLGINLSEGGCNVTTTLDSDLQLRAEEAAARNLRYNRHGGVNVSAFICMDSEGRVLVDIGGRNFAKNQLSYSTQGGLQPGSSFKTFVYAEALREGLIGEGSEVNNNPFVAKAYKYSPSSHKGYGSSVSLFTAFAASLNWPALHTFQSIGYQRGAELIQEDFGFRSKIDPYPATALGSSEAKPIEMAEAYSVIMLDGKRVKPYRIKEVIGPSGDVIHQGQMEYVDTRISPAVCEVMHRLLRGVVTSGTGRTASSCPDAHGKTGTTNNGKSGWFCGYAKGLVGIAWAGSEYYNKKRNKWYLADMDELYGADVAAPIWADIMSMAIERYGSDVKPDFNKRAPRDERRRQDREEEPADDANNEEIPIEDGNNEPVDINAPGAPATTGDLPTTGTDGGVSPPRDPASDTTTPPVDHGVLDPKRPRPGDRPPKPNKPEESDSMTEVEVCADSGLLATRYCPETVNRKFAKNKKPRRRCSYHKSPDEGGGTH